MWTKYHYFSILIRRLQTNIYMLRQHNKRIYRFSHFSIYSAVLSRIYFLKMKFQIPPLSCKWNMISKRERTPWGYFIRGAFVKVFVKLNVLFFLWASALTPPCINHVIVVQSLSVSMDFSRCLKSCKYRNDFQNNEAEKNYRLVFLSAIKVWIIMCLVAFTHL